MVGAFELDWGMVVVVAGASLGRTTDAAVARPRVRSWRRVILFEL